MLLSFLTVILAVLCVSGTSDETQGDFIRQAQNPRDGVHGLELRQLVTISATSSASTPSPSGTSAPTISFHVVPMMTTCSTGLFTWDYVGPSGQKLTLNITNIDVSQPPPPFPSATQILRRQTAGTSGVSALVASNLDPASGKYTWSPVTVPEGWYVMKGAIGSTITFSPVFFVSNGTDTSCLAGLPPLSSSSSPSPSPSSSSSSPSSSAILSSGSSSKSNSGAIAGGVLGGIALIAVACFALLFFRTCRSSDVTRKGRWGGLHSVDSIFGKPPANSRSKRSGSTAAVAAAANAKRRSAAGSNHDPENQTDISQEKLFTPAPVRVARTVSRSPPTSYSNPFEDGTSVSQSGKRTSNNSTMSSFTQDHGNESPVSPTNNVDLANMVQPPPRRSSLNSHSSSTASRRRQPPTYPSNQVEMERLPSSSSGKGGTTKTPRKPVPKYVESVEELAPKEHISSSPNESTLTESPTVSRTNSLALANSDLQKPVHYLVPDMPPPQAD